MKKIDEEIEKSIGETWHVLKNRKSPEEYPTAKEILTFFEESLRNESESGAGPGAQDIVLPGERTVQRIIKPLRERYEALAPGQKELDQAWSLGESHLHRIPMAANKTLVSIHRYCLLTNQRFTIREALWVARLRELVPWNDILLTAIHYATRERINLISENPRGFADLDARVMFLNDDRFSTTYRPAVHSGMVPSIPSPWATAGSSDKIRDIQLDEIRRSGHNMLGIREQVEQKVGVSTLNEALQRTLHRRDVEPPFTDEEEVLYVIWLQNLARAPLWESMSKSERNAVATQLEAELLARRPRIEELRLTRQEWLKENPKDWWHLTGELWEAESNFRPSNELLKEVGSVTDSENGTEWAES